MSVQQQLPQLFSDSWVTRLKKTNPGFTGLGDMADWL